MFIIGIIMFVASSITMTLMSIFAENIAFKTRIDYFKKCLEKDAAFYDETPPTVMASNISKHCSKIQRGLGDKVSNVVYATSGFFLGFAFAFYWGWLFTCILLALIPLAGVSGTLMGNLFESGMVEAMKAYT